MTFIGKCEHGLLPGFCWRHFQYRSPTFRPRTKSNLTQSQEGRVIIPQRQGLPESRQWHYLPHLVADTMVLSMVRLLSVQIGVLNWRWLTIVTATGERQTSGWLTFRMPRGPWFRINRYRVGSSPSQSRWEPPPPPANRLRSAPKPPRNREVS